MNIALYGATGNAGSRILTELLSRGHKVTAIVRNPGKLAAKDGLTIKQGDVADAGKIADAITGADVVVSAYAPPHDNADEAIAVSERLIEAVRTTGVSRLIMVGGAGSLFVAPGVTLIASGHLPQEWMAIAVAHANVLELLKSSDINWTYFSPSAFFQPGERTGKFRLDTDNLVSDANHQSQISMEDYAIALVDEIEAPKYEKQRFTAGY